MLATVIYQTKQEPEQKQPQHIISTFVHSPPYQYSM